MSFEDASAHLGVRHAFRLHTIASPLPMISNARRRSSYGSYLLLLSSIAIYIGGTLRGDVIPALSTLQMGVDPT